MTGTPPPLAELMTYCDSHDIRVLPTDDGNLGIDAPQNALTPELLARLKAHKAELLAMLRVPIADVEAQSSGDATNRGLATELFSEPLGPDGWPLDCIDADELTPCPHCGTLDLWQSVASEPVGRTPGQWRCLKCDPPTASRRLMEAANRIRQQLRDTRRKG